MFRNSHMKFPLLLGRESNVGTVLPDARVTEDSQL
jgi:hypothetical protein